MQPPLPPTFQAVGNLPAAYAKASTSRVKHRWGLSADGDARQLYTLQRDYRRVEDGYSWLFLLSLFAETLLALPRQNEEAAERFNLVLNAGNVHQSLFRTTGLPAAAAAAVATFQAAARMNEDPVMRSMALHSFGMAVIEIIDVYDERTAEHVTVQPALRLEALAALRESLQLVEGAAKRDPEGAKVQGRRTQYALGDLLRRGDATTAQLIEAEQLLEGLDEIKSDLLGTHMRAAALETRLAQWPGPDEDLDRWVQAAKDLITLIQSDDSAKLRFRWHWALSVGRFLQRMGASDQARPYLESAVTYILKDTGFKTNPVALLGDIEHFSHAFTSLAMLYVGSGEPYEALALSETFRGRVLQMAQLTSNEQRKVAAEANTARRSKYRGLFGLGLGLEESPALQLADEVRPDGRPLGPFAEDYDLPGLEDRLTELENSLGDEPTALVSLSLDTFVMESGTLASAVILRAPGSPNPRIGAALWQIQDDVLTAFRSDAHRRPGSFRERRLEKLSAHIAESLLAPLLGHLGDSSRLVLALPGPFGNLPVEIGTEHVTQPVRHISLIPALAFGRRPLNRRNRGRERLLVIGYAGDDLPNALLEVDELLDLFGEDARLLAGADCTKRRVIEELNSGYDFVHIACHGTFNDRLPLESSLWLRDRPRSDAARLRAEEIQELVRLRRGALVTLSACSTALTAESRSNTWNGLPGALLRAGARAVVGARWPVKDGVAAALMIGLYRKLRATDASALACFHDVQDELRAGGSLEDWASFGYLGLP